MDLANSSYASSSQNIVHGESSYDQMELERVFRFIAHSFEDSPERNLPRIEPFVNYFRNCKKVLDIGCGEGLLLGLLRDAGTRGIGIDIDPNKAAIASSKGLEVIVAQADEYLCDKKDEFDGIFLRHIIEHFDGPDGVRLLYLCRKALQPGGIIIVVTPNYLSSNVATRDFWLDVTHRRPYPQPLLEHIFTVLGIAVVKCEVREMGLDLVIVGRVP